MKKILVALMLITNSLDAKQSYNFKGVEYVNNYDGDTFTFHLNCEIDFFCKNVKVRLNGVDTPEIKSKDKCEKYYGLQAKRFVNYQLSNAKSIDLKNCEPGKYYRLVCDIIINKITDLKDVLITNYYGYSYDGGSKKKINWCDF